jgi:hypothetical protein
MRLHLTDLGNFDHFLEVANDCTVAQLREMITTEFSYEMHRILLCFKGKILESDQLLHPEETPDDSVIVLFNEANFPEKSFPKVDHAFLFSLSRYEEFYCKLSSESVRTPEVSQGGFADDFLDRYIPGSLRDIFNIGERQERADGRRRRFERLRLRMFGQMPGFRRRGGDPFPGPFADSDFGHEMFERFLQDDPDFDEWVQWMDMAELRFGLEGLADWDVVD